VLSVNFSRALDRIVYGFLGKVAWSVLLDSQRLVPSEDGEQLSFSSLLRRDDNRLTLFDMVAERFDVVKMFDDYKRAWP
jgi:hypothetical protein